MKRASHIFERLIDPDILDKAARDACRHRKNRREVAEFKENKAANLEMLRQALIDGTYESSEYRLSTKNERGKIRRIADIALYPDRILHNAVCLAAEDEIERRLVDQTYGGRPGKGQHMAVTRLHGYLKKDSRLRYALVMDIRQFYASIDKDILKAKLRRVFKDMRFLDLMDRLIDDYPEPGIPLGSRFSSMLANLYLSDMDHVLAERHHVHYYARFMDDIAVLGYSKQWLRRILDVIRSELARINLEVKGNWQVFPIDARGIRYLGYVIYRDHILIKKATKMRMKKAASKIRGRQADPSYILDSHDIGTVRSYQGCLKWCDGKHLGEVVLGDILRTNGERIMLKEAR